MNLTAERERKLGKYDIRATLGRGATGVVYEAWDPIILRRVAIKTVPIRDESDEEAADILSRCKREAQAAGRLHHPNIVSVFDYGETDDVAYIVMEFVDGRTVKALLDSGERLAPAEIVRLMTALLAGLQYSHDNGVVHRDIKPANIMLTGNGQVKIADFGIARIDSSSITRMGTVLGTPAYMSPEQFLGQTADRRSDIYAAGVVLYQLVTGTRPFEGTMSGIMHQALHSVPRRPSAISVATPPALDAVVAKAMAKRPEDRFETAAAFARALHHAFDSEPTAVMKAPTPRRLPSRIIAAGSLLLLASIGAAVWFSKIQMEKPPAEIATAAAPAPADVTPTPPQAETPSPRFNIADARVLAAGVPCSVLSVSETESPGNQPRLYVSGPALPGDAFDAFITGLRAADRLVDVGIQPLDPRQCPAVTGIADRVRQSRDQNPLRLIIPEISIPAGGRLNATLQGVSDGALTVDLSAGDGSVQRLLQRTVASDGGDVSLTAPAPDVTGQRLLIATVSPSRDVPPQAEIAMLNVVAAVRPALLTPAPAPVSVPVAPARSRLPSLNIARCADIVSRVQLGEVLSDADRMVLQTSCRH
jgi:serine/threonine protein kinase